MLPVFDLPPAIYPKEPKHLTPVNPDRLIPKGAYTIDVAHRRGYLHSGHILYVMDASGSILFLQRSKDLVTCPSTWSLLGEHGNAGESSIESVVRGLEEELGFVALDFDKSSFKGALTVELHSTRRIRDSVKVTISSVTEIPLYYIRHYGSRNGNRVDRQFTYLWLVKFPKRHEDLKIKFDDEVAAHKWVKLDDVGGWLTEDARKHDRLFPSPEGVEDDGPDEGDFCHRTIRSLYEAGLMNMI